ncbi:hypothetical protein GCM10008915_29450 [Bifidobacterium pullorum subsp. gallinarum]
MGAADGIPSVLTTIGSDMQISVSHPFGYPHVMHMVIPILWITHPAIHRVIPKMWITHVFLSTLQSPSVSPGWTAGEHMVATMCGVRGDIVSGRELAGYRWSGIGRRM